MAQTAPDVDATADAFARALLDSGLPRAFLPRQFTGAVDAAFSSDGSLLAVVDFPCRRRVTILDVREVEIRFVHAQRSPGKGGVCDPVAGYHSVAFAPGDDGVLASDRAGTDILTPTGTGALKVSRVAGTHAMNPRDRTMAVPADGGTSVLYRDDAHGVRRALPLDGERVVDLTFTADGRRLIVRTRESLRVWDVARLAQDGSTGPSAGPPRQPVRIPLAANVLVKRVVTDPPGERIAVLGGDAVRVWDLDSGNRLGEIRPDGAPRLECVAFWPEHDYLVTGGSATGTVPAVVIWKVSSGKRVGTLLPGANRAVTALALDSHGRHLAAIDSKGNLVLWLFPRLSLKDAAWNAAPHRVPHLP
jgi:WD40 repeat protein